MENIKINQTIFNIIKVASSNVIKLISGVLVGFVLPKIMGLEDYGLYKTFTLYVTYVGIFALGINDGIYLKFGGKNYNELDKDEFSSYGRSFIEIEFILSILAIIASLIFFKGEYKFVFIMWAFYMLGSNIISYFQTISQITMRFGELSAVNIVQSILTIVAVLAMLFMYKSNGELLSYRIYTVLYSCIILGVSIWYAYHYRDILFPVTRNHRILVISREIPFFIKIGFPLMLANLCSSLILSLDRQFVNVLFDLNTYATYAFAYNLLSLITTATSAVSLVIFPILKRTDESSIEKNYNKLIAIVLILVFFCVLCYFPLRIIINWFLPKYVDSINIFRVILPGLAITSAITIVIHNYYKTIGKNVRFFIISVIILVISASANGIAYVCFRTPISISIASVIVTTIWYIVSEKQLKKYISIGRNFNLLYIVLMLCGFYGLSGIYNVWLSMILYFIFFAVITYLIYKKEIKQIIKTRMK